MAFGIGRGTKSRAKQHFVRSFHDRWFLKNYVSGLRKIARVFRELAAAIHKYAQSLQDNAWEEYRSQRVKSLSETKLEEIRLLLKNPETTTAQIQGVIEKKLDFHTGLPV